MLNQKLRRPIVGLAACVLAGSVFAVSSPASAATTSLATSTLSSSIDAQYGTRTAGSYVENGKVVVNVTDAATAASVAAQGATVRYVAHSGAQLAAADNTLKATLTTPGTAFGVDPVTNKVVVSVDSTVTGAKLDAVKATVAKLGDTATLTSVPGSIEPEIAAGDAIYGGQYRCSLGFNVKSGSTYYFLTAGHCGNVASTWYSNSGHTTVLGTNRASTFPGHDYAIVTYTNSSITKTGGFSSAATPAVGTTVTRRGSTSGTHSGKVTALNTTVNYSEGTVTGMIQTTVCAESGDSGGPLYGGTVAYGLTSGGSGNCTSGGVTYFQPVTAALSAYGVSVF